MDEPLTVEAHRIELLSLGISHQGEFVMELKCQCGCGLAKYFGLTRKDSGFLAKQVANLWACDQARRN